MVALFFQVFHNCPSRCVSPACEVLMSEKSRFDLKTEWDAGRCPIVEGLISGEGRVKDMNVEWVRDASGRLALWVRAAGWSSLLELVPNGKLQWTGVIPLCTASDVDRNLRVVCGEGGLGCDGFVAVIRSDLDEILWIAFFTQSNPFEVVQLAEDCVMARAAWGHGGTSRFLCRRQLRSGMLEPV